MSKWIEKRLEDILLIIKSGGTPKSDNATFYGGEIPFVAIEDITKSNKYLNRTVKTLSELGLQNSNAWIVPENSILYSIYATLGVPIINLIPVTTNQAILGLIPKLDIDREYLYYWLCHFESQIKKFSSQTTQSNLNATIVKNFIVKLPADPAEQARIASILSTVDAAITQTEALIAKYGRVRTGLMQDLLTKGIDEHGQIRSEATHEFKDSPLGRVPIEWEVKPIGEICEMILGKMLNKEAKKGKDQFEYLGNRSVQWGRFDFSNLEEMSFTTYEQEKLKLLKDDVLMCEGGEVGRCAIWQEERSNCYFQKAIHRLRFDQSRVNSDFFVSYFKTLVSRGFLKDYVSQTSIAHLTQEKLATIPVVRPDIDEQVRISKALKKIGDDSLLESMKLKKLQTLKKALMKDLLSEPTDSKKSGL